MYYFKSKPSLIYIVVFAIIKLTVGLKDTPTSGPPNPSEDFSSSIYLQGSNSSLQYSTGGDLYISYSQMKRRFDYYYDYGTIYTEIDRCDLDPMVKYVVQNETCQQSTIANEFASMFGWLIYSFEGGSCFGVGKIYSASFNWGSVTACFDGDIPIYQALVWGQSSQPSAVQYIKFLSFTPDAPSNKVFSAPQDCESIDNINNNNNNINKINNNNININNYNDDYNIFQNNQDFIKYRQDDSEYKPYVFDIPDIFWQDYDII
ncbi:hypothetical protein DLAC_03209 [Tieghemostelium lacteum]|uniref:Uncharacterized protein n=1 Tax=Tieghemostelium lacteum TaxID=361077 RepID=A0A152A1C7_TIELA|nr:hypothetical protein DLAC_03209 [Tieghemostelium lacteum]|eukprot:KYR00063.1 hypothetical protein DLAC_03209 [Tieghemostelium lacteum]